MKRYPICNVPDRAARVRLIDKLMRMGYRHGNMDPETVVNYAPERTYISIVADHDSNWSICTTSPRVMLDFPMWSQPMTLVNSPAHMIAYLKAQRNP